MVNSPRLPMYNPYKWSWITLTMGNWGELYNHLFQKGTSLFQTIFFWVSMLVFRGCNAYDKSMEDPWDVGLVYYPT